MKLTVVTLVLLSAAIFAADEPKQIWIHNEFYAGGMEHKVFDKLARGVPTEDLIQTVLSRVDEAIDNYLLEYHQQLFHGVPYIISTLEETTEKILHGWFVDMEKQLQRVNELSLKVVKAMAPATKSLTDLPVPRGPVLFRGIEEENEILSNFDHLVDRDFSVILNLIEEVYLAGWRRARLAYNDTHVFLKNKFLNNALIPAFARELTKLNEDSNRIKKKVSSETWRNYVNHSTLIISAFNDLKNATIT